MIRLLAFTLLIPFTSSLHATPEKKADFYIAPNGSDEAEGTLEHPFASLGKAQQAIRELKKTKTGDLLVHLRGGRYELTETVVFGLPDSGSKDRSITYAAYPKETPLLSSGQAIDHWEKPQAAIKGLPAAAQEKVLVADVSASFRALFDKDGILPRASSAPFITAKGSTRNKVVFPKSVLKNWSHPTDMEIVVRPHHAWIVNILPVIEFNAEKGYASSNIESSYVMNPLHFLKTTPNCWVENAIEELDEPGEWVLNRAENKLYLWPRNDATVCYPQLNELIRVEGDIDLEGPTDTPVRNLRFDGLTFAHAERYELSPDDAGLQHDWNMFDKDNALLRLRGTENCTVNNCHFLHSGSGAIRVDLHGIKNQITNNHIEQLGGSGILLAGYGPGTKDVNHHNFVSNNHIHHVGQIYWHSPGIFIAQSGENRVANNLIHHTNYTGLIVSGFMEEFFKKGGRELVPTVRWHEIGDKKKTGRILAQSYEKARPFIHTHDNLIEANEIHHVMQKLGDGNAIYIRGAGPNNIIRRNYVHHLITPMIMQCAIRTDGGQRDTLITENIIYKCTSQGMMLKLNNRFENNIIADVIAPPRGYYLSIREGPMTGATVTNNIFYSSQGKVEDFINELPGKFKGGSEDRRGRAVARLEDTTTDHNLYFAVGDPQKATETLRAHQARGVDKKSLVADPLFTDPANGDFSLHPDSPALKLGFKPIDQSEIGLLK